MSKFDLNINVLITSLRNSFKIALEINTQIDNVKLQNGSLVNVVETRSVKRN
jgi:hypothetical protein